MAQAQAQAQAKERHSEQLALWKSSKGANVQWLDDAERLARLTEHLPNCPSLEHVYVTRTGDDFAPREAYWERFGVELPESGFCGKMYASRRRIRRRAS